MVRAEWCRRCFSHILLDCIADIHLLYLERHQTEEPNFSYHYRVTKAVKVHHAPDLRRKPLYWPATFATRDPLSIVCPAKSIVDSTIRLIFAWPVLDHFNIVFLKINLI